MPKIRTTPELFANPRKGARKAAKKSARKSRAKKPRGQKNPRPVFGKRKASHQAFKRKKPASRPLFGKRKDALYAIEGPNAKGVRYYYTGSRFDSNRSHAAFYRDPKTAHETMRAIRSRVPDALRGVGVIRL